MSDKMTKSIRNKLITMAVTVAMISIVVLGVVSWQGVGQMRESSHTMSVDLMEMAAENSEEIITASSLDMLTKQANAAATTVDVRIRNLMRQVEILAASIEELYDNPDAYGHVEVLPPDASNDGEYVGQFIYADYDNVEGVIEEVGLLGNKVSFMNQMTKVLPAVSSTFIATESGFFIQCDDISSVKVGQEAVVAWERPWYISATENQGAAWTEVFQDVYGRGLAATCSYAVYDSLGDLKAVVALGCLVEELSTTLDGIILGETEKLIVIDRSGQVIMVTSNEDNSVEDINIWDYESSISQEIIEQLLTGESGVSNATGEDGLEIYFAYQSLESMPWSVITIIESSEMMQPVEESNEQIMLLTDMAEEETRILASSMGVAMIAGIVASAILAFITGALYANRIANPIRSLEKGVREIAKGRLDYNLDIRTGDEIESLAVAVNHMTQDLQQHIEELTNVTAEKERIGVELSIATQIQTSMLPHVFPAFPQYRDKFDIYATMEPSKEVGGDFYDFFMVDERHLGIVIADVAGKGVPAALFMVVAKTLIKNYAQKREIPADILIHTNNQLCQNNDASMFLTAWVAVLNINTGGLVYANAGHSSPLIRQGNGDFQMLDMDSGLLLGGFEDTRYGQGSLTLQQGDLLFLYTDGVTEAINEKEELYGEERLEENLNKYATLSLQDVLENIKADIDNFAGETPQFDDITMLALRFGKELGTE